MSVYKNKTYGINELVELLKNTNFKNIKQVCTHKRDKLVSDYPNVQTLKRVYTFVRNGLKENLDNTKKLDIALKVFKLTKPQQNVFNDLKNQQLNKDRLHLRAVKFEPYHAKLVNLLKSTNKIDVLIAIAGLTGRRLAEIGCTAKFKPIDKLKLEFEGQLKTKFVGENKVLKIPCLYDSDFIVLQFEKLKNVLGTLTPNLFNNRYSRIISIHYKKHFVEFYEKPHQAKDMRAIYAEYAYTKHGSQLFIAKTKYFSLILGHGDKDNQTGASYEDFKLIFD